MTIYDRLEIQPCKLAPLFPDKETGREAIQHILSEFRSPNFNPNDNLREMIRQFGMVNLWFNIKYICGYSGPYDQINDDLHMDMCNYRQSDDCMKPGARAAGFIHRGAYKSTIWTHGSIPFEVVRWPDIRMRLTSSRIDKAEGFRDTAKMTFTSNDLFASLYPEHVISRNSGKFITPARSKNYPEPTVKVGSTGGASAGDHHNVLLMDDLIDEQDLNAENIATIEMESKIRWFKKCERPLLIPPFATGRVLVWGTRYSMDDLYAVLWNDCKKLVGFQAECNVEAGKTWTIYYRRIIENGESIIPEHISLGDLEKMMKEDSFTTLTQMFNDPQDPALVEFNHGDVKDCQVVWAVDPYIIADKKEIPFSQLNIGMALDPAFTYKGITAKTSRTALVVAAKDWEDNVYILEVATGYFRVSKTFDIIFDLVEKYRGHMIGLLFESNAQQKILEDMLKEERRKRGVHVSLLPKAATTDKDARIRSTLGHYISRGALYVAIGQQVDFIDELRSFPLAKYKKDVLDSAEKVIGYVRKPAKPEDVYKAQVKMMEKDVGVIENCIGY